MFKSRSRSRHERWLDTSSAALSAAACIAVLSAPFIAELPRAGRLIAGATSPSRLVADAAGPGAWVEVWRVSETTTAGGEPVRSE